MHPCDKEILKQLKQGKAPKEVAYEMDLTSVCVVYDIMRWEKTDLRNKT